MQCPQCGRDNAPAYHFCIYCGATLDPAAELPIEPVQPVSVEAELRRLRQLIAVINERLTALERLQGMAPSAASQPLPPPVAAAVAGVPAPFPPTPPPGFKPAPREWEQALGGNWLARIGVLALIIGIGFFFKLAFDNQWIGPSARILLGVAGGLGMLGLGYYWHRKYPGLAQAISGGGIAMLYISVASAFAAYQLVAFLPALGFLVLVSSASAAIAIWYDSMALAAIAIIGAFIAPFVLGAFPSAPGVTPAVRTAEGIQLLAYILVVDVAVLALSTFRNWRWFTLLALGSSLVAYGVWYDRFGIPAVGLGLAQTALTVMFLIFVAATTLYHVVWRRPAREFDLALMLLNAASYFGISFGQMSGRLTGWMGGFAFLLALFYGALAYALYRRTKENPTLGFFALGISLLFLTIAVPLQVGNRAWTTVAWAAEGASLIWVSVAAGMPRIRWYGYAAFLVTVMRLVFFDTPVDPRTFAPLANERFLAFVISIAALYWARYLLRHHADDTKETRDTALVFTAAANFFTLWLITAEIVSSFDAWWLASPPAPGQAAALRSFETLSLTVAWALYAVALIIVGIARQSRPLRLGGLGLLAVPIAKLFAYDVFTLELVYRIIAFVGLGLLLIVSAYLYQRHGKAIKGFLTQA